jgi:hypothetical protein
VGWTAAPAGGACNPALGRPRTAARGLRPAAPALGLHAAETKERQEPPAAIQAGRRREVQSMYPLPSWEGALSDSQRTLLGEGDSPLTRSSLFECCGCPLPQGESAQS